MSGRRRAACRPWLRTAEILTVLPFLIFLWLVYTGSHLRALFILTQVPGWALQFILHQRIERRVNLKVAAERREGGRLRSCAECGYDLRESPEWCPECGADARVVTAWPGDLAKGG